MGWRDADQRLGGLELFVDRERNVALLELGVASCRERQPLSILRGVALRHKEARALLKRLLCALMEQARHPALLNFTPAEVQLTIQRGEAVLGNLGFWPAEIDEPGAAAGEALHPPGGADVGEGGPGGQKRIVLLAVPVAQYGEGLAANLVMMAAGDDTACDIVGFDRPDLGPGLHPRMQAFHDIALKVHAPSFVSKFGASREPEIVRSASRSRTRWASRLRISAP